MLPMLPGYSKSAFMNSSEEASNDQAFDTAANDEARRWRRSSGCLGSKFAFEPQEAFAFSQSGKLLKFVQPLRGVGGITGIPVAASDGTVPAGPPTAGTLHYTIDINQFTDKLHTSLPSTTLWGYNPAPNGVPAVQKHLGGIIVADKGVPIQITFRNNLPLPHIIPVDPTVMGNLPGFANNRTAVHLHGGLVPWISDGGPFDWWDPSGAKGASFQNNIVLNPGAAPNEAEYYYPNNQSARLMWYHDHAWGITRINAYAGIASGYVIYDDYEVSTLGSAPYNLPGPIGPQTHYLVFQDKIFVNNNITATDPTWPSAVPNSKPGDLWYAHAYEVARWALGPGGLSLPTPSSVIPEFFGDTMLVNGTVSPYLEVEPRQYRLRMLNACNARFLNPRLVYAKSNVVGAVASTEPSPKVAGPGFIQIGSEGGFLPAPAPVNGPKQPIFLVAPGERADLIVDFSAVPVGSYLILYNDAPAPFPKGDGRNDYHPGNPKTPASVAGSTPNTRTLLQVRVKAAVGLPTPVTLPAVFTPTDPFLVAQTPGVPTPYTITVPPTAKLPPAPDAGSFTGKATVATVYPTPATVTATIRYLTLNETFDAYGRLIQYLGTAVATTAPGAKVVMFGREYPSTPTEVIPAGSYEIWEIANLTADVHPIHFHLVNVQVLSRQAFSTKQYVGGLPNYQGQVLPPDPNEMGWKETVRMNPGEVTRVFMRFDLAAVPFTVPVSPRTGGHEYVWHCHILEHEEHDMMRPLVVL